MTGPNGANYYEKGLELAEAGKYQEGLNCIREHLRSAPHDVEALNDAGAILHCLGRTSEAIDCLTRAWRLGGASGQIMWNLVEAYLAGGMASEAASLFDGMERQDLLNVDVLNRTAGMLLDQDKKGEAIEVLLRSYRRWPEQDVLLPMLDVIRSRRPKIALLCRASADDNALADIGDFIQQRFETEILRGWDAEHAVSLTDRADLLWVHGGGDWAIKLSQSAGQGKTIVSLRHSDVEGRWPRDVRWENIDLVVQIGSTGVEQALLQQVPDIRHRTRLTVVPYAVNLDRYMVRRRERGKNLVCMGPLDMEANPAFVLQCMQKLHYMDPHYKLFFSGRIVSPILELYLKHMVRRLRLGDAVFFEPDPGDLNAWLSDKHFVVAGGTGESQVEAILAGMACGLRPAIHHFPGAENWFPPECLFDIAEQFCECVLSRDYDAERYRRLVEDRYALDQQLSKVNAILLQFEREIESRMPTCSSGWSRAGENSATRRPHGLGTRF